MDRPLPFEYAKDLAKKRQFPDCRRAPLRRSILRMQDVWIAAKKYASRVKKRLKASF
ncbi:hypothetical protein QYH69_04025 [Paraburkholderia sp. SARCC-3016]|nr:hypothetical protein [Paraburkholderia sp. SARCC-3016]